MQKTINDTTLNECEDVRSVFARLPVVLHRTLKVYCAGRDLTIERAIVQAVERFLAAA